MRRTILFPTVILSALLTSCALAQAPPGAAVPLATVNLDEARLRVHFIDIGPGMAALIETPLRRLTEKTITDPTVLAHDLDDLHSLDGLVSAPIEERQQRTHECGNQRRQPTSGKPIAQQDDCTIDVA